jgi:nickel-dependent lactate racemase
MIKLLQKRGDLPVDLPPNWKIIETIFKEPAQVDGPPVQLMKRALGSPIGAPPLEQLLRPDSKVAIVVDDLTRQTPVKVLLPGLLEVMDKQGVSAENLDIVIGVGTHRPMTAEEISERVGREVVERYRVQNHDARSPDLVVMGELPGYGPVSFNAAVAGADVKIAVGSIIPHVHNGFGGGPKNIMPGICDFDTIRRHHMKNVLPPGSRVGIVEGNPFLDDTVRIAELAEINFAVQCLGDTTGRIYEILAGDLLEVHRAGMKMQTERLGVRVSGKADVTLVSSYPYDEGVQVMKAFMPAALATKEGGSIFVVTELVEPLPDFFLESVRKVRGGGGAEAEERALEKLKRCEPLIEEAAMDFNMAMILILAMTRRFNLVLVGHAVLKDAADAMGCEYSPDLRTALDKESGRLKEASVSIIPGGGYIYPIISAPFYLF